MTKCYVVHRIDKNNVGDISTNPLQYFMKPEEYTSVDILNIGQYSFDPNIPIIAGGGGLLANEFMGESLRDLTVPPDTNSLLNIGSNIWQHTSAANKDIRNEFFSKLNPLITEYVKKLSNDKSPRIVWGAGHNGNYEKKLKGRLDYPGWLRNFDLVGVRDYAQEHEWVPCASCMHPALREKHIIKHPVIWFEHKKQLIKSTEFGTDPIPRYVNSGDNITETIRLLGSADVIITNSYHGAFWGTLLGRKVIVVEAWSSKFNAMKHRPYFLSKGENWKNVIINLQVYNTALDDCIDATQQYWNRVKQCL
jgi:hypothetical protein